MKQLKFNNKKFRIMQIADVQEKPPVNSDTLKLIDLAIRREMPDLIVFTGDQIAGYYKSFSGDTEAIIADILQKITKTADELDIPYCATFGNHDCNCGISNRVQMEKLYRTLPGFVYTTPHNADDAGTYSIQLKDSNGDKNIFSLYLIDSNQKGSDNVYMPVRADQVQWFKDERDRLKEENGVYLPALVFQHIPLPEYFNVIKKVSRFTRGAVEAFDDHKNEYYVLPDELKADGFMYESPATPVINNGEFAAFKEKGDVLGVFVGHDHNNSFVGDYQGIKLCYCQGCGFNTYGPGKERGVRIIDLDEDDLSSFTTYTVKMEDLCDYKPSRPLQEFVLANMPSSTKEVMHIVKDTCIAAAAVAGVIAARYIIKSRG